jgi:hypothetical protein
LDWQQRLRGSTAEIDSLSAISGQATKAKSLLALILEALHQSRRLQAQHFGNTGI